MPKVKGPLFSLSASGTFKNMLEFRTGGGKTIVAPARAPNPIRSLAQQGQSTRFKNASAAWASLGNTAQATWKARATKLGKKGYQFFLAEYIGQKITPPALPILP